MDPIAVVTAILTFATVVSDTIELKQAFSKTPKVLKELERDYRVNLKIIAHAAIAQRESRRLRRPSPLFAGTDIKLELTESMDAIRTAVASLLDQISNATPPPGLRHHGLGEMLLLQYGAKASVHDADGKTPLHTATGQDNVSVTAALLAEDIACCKRSRVDRANACDAQGRPALWYASGLGSAPSVFDLLVSLGPVVVNHECRDEDLPTALWAAAARAASTPPALLGAGANHSLTIYATLLGWRDGKNLNAPIIDVNAGDGEDATPLMHATEAGQLRLVVAVYKADARRRDDFGNDAFAAACAGKHLSTAAFLLGRPVHGDDGGLHGRGLDEANAKGQSALHLAAELGTWRWCGGSSSRAPTPQGSSRPEEPLGVEAEDPLGPTSAAFRNINHMATANLPPSRTRQLTAATLGQLKVLSVVEFLIDRCIYT
ncbi:hypothetical protein DL770_008941 [Monosporascus sp. CRB-9-2]|nr:hypothetical protein DL770_008941 [Monosporascus sp. CRB-9-2]